MDEECIRTIAQILADADATDELGEFLRLAKADVGLIMEFASSMDSRVASELVYKNYIATMKPTCKVCNTGIADDHYKERWQLVRHLDCGATDGVTGCCCCGSGPAYHQPKDAQFFCSADCINRYRAEKWRLEEMYGAYRTARYRGLPTLSDEEREALDKRHVDITSTQYVPGLFSGSF